jgi:hypothetical protein
MPSNPSKPQTQSQTQSQILTIETNKTYNRLLNDPNLTFNKLRKIICDSDVKDMTRVFLRGIFGRRATQFKAELFLSVFLIYRFHSVVFEGEGTTMDKHLLEIVRDIVKVLRCDLLKNINIISHKLLEFKDKFEVWKQLDLNQQLKLYSETYYELEMLKLKMKQHHEASTIYSESIKPLQTKIMNMVNFIAGNRGIEYVEKYKDTHFKLTINLEQKLRENLKKAFWAKLQEDLFQSPPCYDQIYGIFKDIHLLYMSIINCLPEDRKKIREDELNSVLDCEYIKLLQEQTTLTEEDILITSVNILEQIRKIGFAVNDIKTNEMISKVNRFVESNSENVENNEYFPEIIQLFQLIIDELEELQKYLLNRMIDDKTTGYITDETIDLK